jgi:hypothetical protein
MFQNTRLANFTKLFDVLTMTINFICRSEEIAQCAIKLELVNDCFTELRGEIAGPPGEKDVEGCMISQV